MHYSNDNKINYLCISYIGIFSDKKLLFKMDTNLLIKIINNGIVELNTISSDYLKSEFSTEEIEILIQKTELIIKELYLLKKSTTEKQHISPILDINSDKSSVSEPITSYQNKPNTEIKENNNKDFREYIGINDKFIFIRELFGGNAKTYADTIEQINNTKCIEEATNIISKEDWNKEDESTKLFIELLNRKFS